MSIFVFRHINIYLRSANNHIHLSAKYFSATLFSFFSSLPSFYYFWFVYNVWFIHYSWHKNKMGGTLLLFLSTFSVTLCSFDNHLLSLDFTSSSCSSPSHSNIDRHSFFWENKKLIDKWKLCSLKFWCTLTTCVVFIYLNIWNCEELKGKVPAQTLDFTVGFRLYLIFTHWCRDFGNSK